MSMRTLPDNPGLDGRVRRRCLIEREVVQRQARHLADPQRASGDSRRDVDHGLLLRGSGDRVNQHELVADVLHS